jgi:hypothetical protein
MTHILKYQVKHCLSFPYQNCQNSAIYCNCNLIILTFKNHALLEVRTALQHNVYIIHCLTHVLLPLTVQPYMTCGLLHQIIRGFSTFNELDQISQFYPL